MATSCVAGAARAARSTPPDACQTPVVFLFMTLGQRGAQIKHMFERVLIRVQGRVLEIEQMFDEQVFEGRNGDDDVDIERRAAQPGSVGCCAPYRCRRRRRRSSSLRRRSPRSRTPRRSTPPSRTYVVAQGETLWSIARIVTPGPSVRDAVVAEIASLNRPVERHASAPASRSSCPCPLRREPHHDSPAGRTPSSFARPAYQVPRAEPFRGTVGACIAHSAGTPTRA